MLYSLQWLEVEKNALQSAVTGGVEECSAVTGEGVGVPRDMYIFSCQKMSQNFTRCQKICWFILRLAACNRIATRFLQDDFLDLFHLFMTLQLPLGLGEECSAVTGGGENGLLGDKFRHLICPWRQGLMEIGGCSVQPAEISLRPLLPIGMKGFLRT